MIFCVPVLCLSLAIPIKEAGCALESMSDLTRATMLWVESLGVSTNGRTASRAAADGALVACILNKINTDPAVQLSVKTTNKEIFATHFPRPNHLQGRLENWRRIQKQLLRILDIKLDKTDLFKLAAQDPNAAPALLEQMRLALTSRPPAENNATPKGAATPAPNSGSVIRPPPLPSTPHFARATASIILK
eukprot:GHVT01066390.1.p2 GENE.GHVT01066390.1~~GHVT01066390.1.p2  ORF type:complete len:191 (-),score=33.37 GHVT01066390.1:450-1022(-)